MLRSLAQSGPGAVQPLFRELVAEAESPEANLVRATERMRIQVADPLFDDLALALTLHWKRGGKLVPALTAICEDWGQSLRLAREAKALRAGIEASALLLTLLPFVFVLLIHFLAPTLLAPLATLLGQIVLAAVVAWMAIGYRVLQQIAQAPGEERMAFNQSAL
jgi:Flp pilus assembly protein TadB